jgi:hypothetical protein
MVEWAFQHIRYRFCPVTAAAVANPRISLSQPLPPGHLHTAAIYYYHELKKISISNTIALWCFLDRFKFISR